MDADLFLINFNENKPHVSVCMPLAIEKASACKRSTYRAVLSAGIVEETNNEDESKKDSISFSKNIDIKNIQEEVRLFFKNFISMLETIKDRDIDFPLYTATPWKASIPMSKEKQLIIEERYFHSFKARIFDIIGTTETSNKSPKIIPFRKRI